MTIYKNKRLSKAGREGKKKPIDSIEKKEWIFVKTPMNFGSNIFGHTLLNKSTSSIPNINNKIFNVSLADINENEKDSFVKIKLKGSKLEYGDLLGFENEKKCLTDFYGSEITRDKLSSMVKKWQTTIESAIDIKTEDGFFLRIFWIAFSKKKKGQLKKAFYLNSSQIRAIRRKISEIILQITNKRILANLLIGDIYFSRHINNQIVRVCRKIAPIHSFYFRKIKMLKEKR
ncbi:40S ribosomal protein S3A (nucleomorph) [Chroomonas mesostigmatica CCMP1168]|uniref:40S ribosomal protein S3A n=1 Tax=Chroomonas mesostigmatica CCMP1168 TaxID=1195612 RepID=J7G5D7_9CRYP|nr:40S ribosomal protein S3A [Chroomonas mesostigmatica CCMP1168]